MATTKQQSESDHFQNIFKPARFALNIDPGRIAPRGTNKTTASDERTGTENQDRDG